MDNEQKLLGEQRREFILIQLKQLAEPLTGTELAQKAGVSRQVIVQDIALLKAKDEPIIATPQGYLYIQSPQTETYRKVIACQHLLDKTELELTILVDHGVKVLDVIVEHPVYGEIIGSLMVKNRYDVQQFLKAVHSNGAKLLSSLTDGVHLHTIEAVSESQINAACSDLEKEGILLTKN